MRWIAPFLALLLLLTVPTCMAGGVEQDQQATFSSLTVVTEEVTPPPPPPPGGPIEPPTPPRGDIIADIRVTPMKPTYRPGETLRALVDINNTLFTFNDVILRISIRDDTIYATVEEAVRVGPGMTQRIMEIEVPDIPAGQYLVHVEMIEPTGEITWASAPFTVEVPLITTDWLFMLGLVALILAALAYGASRRSGG